MYKRSFPSLINSNLPSEMNQLQHQQISHDLT
jgi:hypothetical protein